MQVQDKEAITKLLPFF